MARSATGALRPSPTLNPFKHPSIVKIKHLLAPLGAFCAIAALVGCASTNRQVSESSLDETTVNRDGGQFLERALKMGGAGDSPAPVGDPPSGTALSHVAKRPLSLARAVVSVPSGGSPVPPGNFFANTLLAEFSQQVNLSQPEFQKPNPDTNKPVTLDERQQLDTTVGARENFSALDETGDGRINLTEFLKQVTKHSKRYQFFAGADTVNDGYVSWDKELFRQPGWQLFAIQF